MPSEGNSPTIAGVKTELVLYHFVDGRLFRITVLFDTEAIHLIREAIVTKHGLPTSETKEPVEIAWQNAVSTIRLVRGMMRPKKRRCWCSCTMSCRNRPRVGCRGGWMIFHARANRG